ncbi:fibroblast growth factor receptor-like 1 [Salminus brasiliensis]|uniref:fibroblast growth factor receptor-like 1 n=1 Tax=Salminus brasiliensis TaxID=930266 RepID=UPI003B82E007
MYYLKKLAMIGFYVTVLFTTELGEASNVDIACPDGLKVIQKGENVSLTCSFSYSDAPVISWLKKIPGEQPVLITSSVISFAQFYNDFEKSSRFHASQGKSSFTLNILHAEPSDSATYICAASYYSNIALSDCTVLVLKGALSSHYTVLQHPASDPVQLGGNTTLQCSILTNNSAGDHSVYWFKHGSGESHPGIIYTHGNRSDQCEESSETGSPTQSCVYKLPKNNLSPSDAGTYYCAVAACGEILFGNGTKLDFVENRFLDSIVIVLAASNIIFMVVVLFLYRKLHSTQHKASLLKKKQSKEQQ